MKKVEWTDGKGYMRGAFIRDEDGPERASYGIQVAPPDVDVIDWDAVKRDLHNELYRRGILTWEDLMGAPGGGNVLSAISSLVLDRRVRDLLRAGGV